MHQMPHNRQWTFIIILICIRNIYSDHKFDSSNIIDHTQCIRRQFDQEMNRKDKSQNLHIRYSTLKNIRLDIRSNRFDYRDYSQKIYLYKLHILLKYRQNSFPRHNFLKLYTHLRVLTKFLSCKIYNQTRHKYYSS